MHKNSYDSNNSRLYTTNLFSLKQQTKLLFICNLICCPAEIRCIWKIARRAKLLDFTEVAHNPNKAFRQQTRFLYRAMLIYVHKTASFSSTLGNRAENISDQKGLMGWSCQSVCLSVCPSVTLFELSYANQHLRTHVGSWKPPNASTHFAASMYWGPQSNFTPKLVSSNSRPKRGIAGADRGRL